MDAMLLFGMDIDTVIEIKSLLSLVFNERYGKYRCKIRH